MKEEVSEEKEISVYLGKETKLPVRLILQRVPDQVYEQRIREKTQKSKGQGRGQLTAETKETEQFIRKTLSQNHWLESKNKKKCFPELLEIKNVTDSEKKQKNK